MLIMYKNLKAIHVFTFYEQIVIFHICEQWNEYPLLFLSLFRIFDETRTENRLNSMYKNQSKRKPLGFRTCNLHLIVDLFPNNSVYLFRFLPKPGIAYANKKEQNTFRFFYSFACNTQKDAEK